MAGKKTVRCQVCHEKCYRLQIQHSHRAGIKKEFRALPEAKRPEDAREEPRYDVPRYVHCPRCGRPRDLRGHPLSPESKR